MSVFTLYVSDMNRPQYAILDGNTRNVFAVDSLTGRIYAVGEIVFRMEDVSFWSVYVTVGPA